MTGLGSGAESAEGVVLAALAAALRDAVGLQALNGVSVGPPVRATPPCAELGEVLGIDWSVKDRAGRELRVAVTLRDAGETCARVQALGAAAERAIAALPRALDGWDVASVALVRSRLAATAPGHWTMMLDHRVRVLARAPIGEDP